ncbi:hypothetical protein C0J52_01650 [Blattella germanica]|nr:hypothetical protein C0J52_01650 [Blattella germanica]
MRLQLHIIYAVSNIWVYPVLEVLNWWQRVVFFLFGTGLILGMYFVGEFVNRQVWGKTLQQLETGKSRKKTK